MTIPSFPGLKFSSLADTFFVVAFPVPCALTYTLLYARTLLDLAESSSESLIVASFMYAFAIVVLVSFPVTLCMARTIMGRIVGIQHAMKTTQRLVLQVLARYTRCD